MSAAPGTTGGWPPMLAGLHVQPAIAARKRGEREALISLDLGLSHVRVPLLEAGLALPDGQVLSWPLVDALAEDALRAGGETGHTAGHCFVFREGAIERVQVFSPAFSRLYSLAATPAAPTMLVSGIPMHRIKGSDPQRDTVAKVRTLTPLVGRVLDTATGLGYTAIEAAKHAQHVTTCELDPAVLDVARLNPWSAALFDNPRITQMVGDSFDLVRQFDDGAFARIVHDPPMFNLAGELYSTEFYRQLHRVLARNGRLFHYVGNPESPSGHRVTRGVVRRLQEAGFSRVQTRPEAFGLLAAR